jgi:hypothetical protein
MAITGLVITGVVVGAGLAIELYPIVPLVNCVELIVIDVAGLHLL